MGDTDISAIFSISISSLYVPNFYFLSILKDQAYKSYDYHI